jgi:CrcB protein
LFDKLVGALRLCYGFEITDWTMARFFWICMAGALGTGTRYLVGMWADRRFGKAFPYGTLLVNISGCFLLSFVLHIALRSVVISPTLRLVLTTGFMGGLTTYSSFNYDTMRLVQSGAYSSALLYFAGTLGACFLAGLLGIGAGHLCIASR